MKKKLAYKYNENLIKFLLLNRIFKTKKSPCLFSLVFISKKFNLPLQEIIEVETNLLFILCTKIKLSQILLIIKK